jgi:hypothetical protein
VNRESALDEPELRELLDDPSVPDDGFSSAVMARVRRQRVFRRSVLHLASVGACLAISRFLALEDLARVPAIEVDGALAAALLVVVGLCGWLWVDTEPISLVG